MEYLVAPIRELQADMKAKIEATQEKKEALQEAMGSVREDARASVEEMKAKRERMEALKACLGATEACIEKTEAYQEKRKANQEERDAVAKHQEVSNEKAAVEATGALEDRFEDQRLAAGCRRQLRKRTRGNDGGSRRKFEATRGRLTRSAVPAPRKSHGLKETGKTLGNGIKDRDIKQRLRLGREKTLNEALGQKFEPEAVKIGSRAFRQPPGNEEVDIVEESTLFQTEEIPDS
jgi:hypothetical protein